MDRCAEIKAKFYAADKFPLSMGMELIDLQPGYSVVEMQVGEEMVNFHQIAHGGVVFSLADTAFGLASNTKGEAVALQVSVNYLAPARPGEILRATATETKITRSTGLYDISVTNANGDVIALMRGTVYRRQQRD